MFTELYIEALLVDEVLANKVWELWNAGVIADDLAAKAWFLMIGWPRYWLQEIVASRREPTALTAIRRMGDELVA